MSAKTWTAERWNEVETLRKQMQNASPPTVPLVAADGRGNLVLARKANESITIGSNIEVEILEIRGDVVKIAVRAPRTVPVNRTEIVRKPA